MLLARDSDFIPDKGAWSIGGMRSNAQGSLVEDRFRLRRNACRVLLTRARDATVAHVPPLPTPDETDETDETDEHLPSSGLQSLDSRAE